MKAETAQRIIAVQQLACEDESYRALLAEYRTLDRQFLAVLPTMTKEQYETVTNYLALTSEMHRRLLEIACGFYKNVEKDQEFL